MEKLQLANVKKDDTARLTERRKPLRQEKEHSKLIKCLVPSRDRHSNLSPARDVTRSNLKKKEKDISKKKPAVYKSTRKIKLIIE